MAHPMATAFMHRVDGQSIDTKSTEQYYWFDKWTLGFIYFDPSEQLWYEVACDGERRLTRASKKELAERLVARANHLAKGGKDH